jgi:hypothetical protein
MSTTPSGRDCPGSVKRRRAPGADRDVEGVSFR